MEPLGSKSEGQPTYTTVGSVYNPNATPIQPPTRRGRTNRYQSYNSPPGDLTAGFPPNILASLREASSGSPRAPGNIIRYSPLQQNHDRAVTPVYDRAPPVVQQLGMSTPGMRTGNVPAIPLCGMASKHEAAASNTGDTDSVNSEDALAARFNVKGLTNLASYPNPMQQTARKALAKARNANIGLISAETSSSFSYASSDLARDRQPGLFGGTTLSTGPGAPQPLTAGPPGQRQYKPSAIEGSIKTLVESTAPSNLFSRTKSQEGSFPPAVPRKMQNEDGLTISHIEAAFKARTAAAGPVVPVLQGANSVRADSIERLTKHPDMVAEASTEKTQPRSFLAGDIQELCQHSIPDPAKPHLLPIYDTKGPETIQIYYPGGLPKSYEGLYAGVPIDWAKYHPLDPHWPIYNTRSEQQAKVYRHFYAGTSKLGDCSSTGSSDILEGNAVLAFNQTTGENISEQFGKIATIGHNGDVRYHHMAIDDANSSEVATHSEPLLNMLFLSLLDYSRYGTEVDKWHGGFVEAETSLINSTEGANNSFFAEPEEASKTDGTNAPQEPEEPRETGSYRPPRRRARRSMMTRHL